MTIFDLLIGDKVTWTNTRRNGRRVTLSLRQGRVVDVSGETITVRSRGRGKDLVVYRSRLRKAGEVSELTEFALGFTREVIRTS
jgi:hypothetical protein